jgi:hypothetical protein
VEEIGDRVWKRLEAEMDKHDLSLRSLFGDGWSAPALNRKEHRVLNVISQSKGEVSGALGTLDRVHEMSGLGTVAISLTLRRLSKRGLMTSDLKITEQGERALARARAEGKWLAQEDILQRGSTETVR